MKTHTRTKAFIILENLPRLFTYSDVDKLTGNANVFLTRALRSGYVQRLAKGSYFNYFYYKKEPPKIEEIACFVRTPSYISCEWAMNYHNILLQVPYACTAVTLHPTYGSRNKIAHGSYTIEYSSIKEKLFFGFDTKDGVSIARPEKAILDASYLRGRIPYEDELELHRLDTKKLKEMSAVFPATTRRIVESLFGEPHAGYNQK